jgi:hypothetical protein
VILQKKWKLKKLVEYIRVDRAHNNEDILNTVKINNVDM